MAFRAETNRGIWSYSGSGVPSMTGTEISAALAAFLLALGVAVSPYEYMGGMTLALWSAYVIRAWRAEEGRKGILMSLLTAASIAHAVSMLHPHLTGVPGWGRVPFGEGQVPLQMQMWVAGAFSQAVAEFIAVRSPGLIKWAADKCGIPGG